MSGESGGGKEVGYVGNMEGVSSIRGLDVELNVMLEIEGSTVHYRNLGDEDDILTAWGSDFIERRRIGLFHVDRCVSERSE